jgi:hypothetical protein
MTELGRIGPDEIYKRLDFFESTFGFSTREFVKSFSDGELEETPEFHEWAHYAALSGLIQRPVPV